MTKKLLTLLVVLLFTGCFSDETTSNKKATDTELNDSNTTQKIEVSTKPKIENLKSDKSSLFTLTTIKGKSLNIDELDGGLAIHELKDKVVFLIFFGHRCPPCLAEIPALIELTKEGHKDLEIIALEVQGLNNKSLEKFAKHKGINYHLISADNNQDFISYVGGKAGWSGAIPFLLAMDSKGVVQMVHTGGLGKAQFDNILKEIKALKNKVK
jgi:thiol-disulfide isomerase/thioredoxin